MPDRIPASEDARRIVVAAIQMDTQTDPETSFATARRLTERAIARGAQVVALPENVLSEDPKGEAHDSWIARFSGLARELCVAIVAGTIREPAAGDARPFQSSLVFDREGQEVARYRKVHLFDVAVPNGPVEKESATLRPGPVEEIRAFELPPLGRCGVGICYDLRFPELWRRLVKDGARVLFAPASFALQTGKDHWHVLLRARAIENLSFVVAPAQIGSKPGGRQRYGHALVVDPWGTVLADAGDSEGFALAELDFAVQDRARRAIPCLDNARLL